MRAPDHTFTGRTMVTTALMVTLLLLATPSWAQLNQPLHHDGWILAAARTQGLHGSIWRTDLWLVADRNGAQVTVQLCRTGENGTAVESHVLTMTDNRMVLHIEDVVGTLLGDGTDGWLGAIHYSSDAAVQAWARVYSTSADGSRSYGQVVEGQASANASPDDEPWESHEQQRMYATRHTADGRFRVNVGVVNPSPVDATYGIAIFNSAGIRRDRIFVDVPAMSMVQLNDPFAAVDGGEWSDSTIRVVCNTEGGTTFAYASVVDNATNDAYFVRGAKERLSHQFPATNCPLHDDGWVLAAAHTPGLHGSIWRTDLWIVAPLNSWQASVELSFHPADSDGTAAETFTYELTSDQEVYYIEDVVEQFLGLGDTGWLGAIHYTTSHTDVQVWARVYSISADGTASYGQLVEGIPTGQMSPDQEPWDYREQQYVFAARHTADGRFRVNFGIVNPTPLPAAYFLDAYGADLNCPPQGCADLRVNVPPYSMVQLSDPFGAWQDGDWAAAIFQLHCVTDGAGGFLYASVVDNATNDAYFVRGVKLLGPGP